MNKIITSVLNEFKYKKIELKEFSKVKVGPISFEIECFDVDNIGRVSYLNGKGLLGLMKMETLMITPLFNDSPLFSYDEVKVLKNDTFIIEMYNTCKDKKEYNDLLKIKEKYNYFKKHELEKRWYDNLRCKESLSFKEKGKNKFAELLKEYLSSFLNDIKNDNLIDVDTKKDLHNQYVDKLINEGGPSTDVFIKHIGKEKTAVLFKKYLFGTDK